MIARRTLLAASALLPVAAQAQADYPNRPVRIIVPFPPGQAADIVTRLIADELSRRWPQRVVVENRAGGAGVPALEAGARSAPDGYTLINGTSGTLGINPGVVQRLPYDPLRDFAAITNVAMVPLLIIAHPSFPAGDLDALLAKARAEPGSIDVASAGPATSQHMAAEMFAHQAGIRLNIVHYRGSGPAVTERPCCPCRHAGGDPAQGQRRCRGDPARGAGGGAHRGAGDAHRSWHARRVCRFPRERDREVAGGRAGSERAAGRVGTFRNEVGTDWRWAG